MMRWGACIGAGLWVLVLLGPILVGWVTGSGPSSNSGIGDLALTAVLLFFGIVNYGIQGAIGGAAVGAAVGATAAGLRWMSAR